jgi:hypothetical protein
LLKTIAYIYQQRIEEVREKERKKRARRRAGCRTTIFLTAERFHLDHVLAVDFDPTEY